MVIFAVCAGIGVLVGPLLAGLTVQVPNGLQAVTPGVLSGGGAPVRRVAATSLSAGSVFGSLSGLPARWLPAVLVVAAAAVVLVQVDVRLHRLPDLIVLPAALSFGVLALLADRDSVVPMLLTGLAFFAVFYLLAMLTPDGLGFGDVKLAGLIGLVIGALDPQLTVIWLVGLSAASLLWIGVLVLGGRATLRSQVAFGPPMLIGLWAALLVVAWWPAVSLSGG